MHESEPAAEPPHVEIVRGTPSEEELAALIAVVSEAYVREAQDAVAEEPRVSVWQRTQRTMRAPLRRDIPWGRFSG
ncbi:acyl-CoA carboxylase subunit epsilon [Microbacterium sp.]|uniref:acyl-CoA carboxylase subunit epsilon n=1 Tax=Microbacterium sp. TaxID=51671 RepID=UPI002810DF05|nr:acyl-CoA carboxylase subunit epsilon [Microbacterium sp.]